MPTRDPFVMAELLAQPWAMEPRALEAFAAEMYAANELVDGQAMVPTGDEPGARKPLNVRDGVAHIAIDGPMLKRVSPVMKFLGVRATATPDVAADIDRAIADQSVKAIMLDIDSPGGIVSSVPELADKIASADKVKPIHAHAGDMMASAAYWVGSQARTVTASKSSMVGSIGVCNVMADTSAQAERQGVKVHVVASAPLKSAGVPGSKITDDQIEDARRLVGDYNAMFQAAICNSRGMSADAVASVATGQVWLGAEAMANGLIDGLADPEAAHAGCLQVKGFAAAIPAVACVETTPQTGAEAMTMANVANGAGTPATQDVEKLKADVEAYKAALATAQAQQRNTLIEKYAERVPPSAVAAMREYGEFCGADMVKFENHLKSLPVVVRAERLSSDAVPADSKPAQVQTSRADEQMMKHIGADSPDHLRRLEALADAVKYVKADGRCVTHDDRVMTRDALLKSLGFAVALFAMLFGVSANAGALSQKRGTTCKGTGVTQAYLMTASKTVYAGGLVMITSAGTAEAAAASASNHGVVGVAQETKTSAASGEYWLKVTDRIICSFAGTSLQQDDVGVIVYAEDDQTVDETVGSNEPVAGILVHYVSASVGWVYIDAAVNSGRTNVVTNPLVLTGSLTLSEGAVASQPGDTQLKVLEGGEDVILTFNSNEIAVSTSTGVTRYDFGAIGVKTAAPLMLLDKVRFCGNGANATTAWYAGPASLESQYGTDMTTAGAGCDANDNATESTADAVVNATAALKVVAMQCSIEAGGANDVYTFQLRDDTADVTGVTCNVTLDGAAPKGCNVILEAPVTVAAGSALAVKQVAATDDDMSAKGMECVVYVTF